MGFYFRKSFGLGPLRLNASKRGLGLSAGVRGARLGVDARGRAYIHCGAGGVYYRAFLGGQKPQRVNTPQTNGREVVSTSVHQSIESANVSGMVPDSAIGLLEELQKRQSIVSWQYPFAFGCGALALVALGNQSSGLAGIIALVGIVGTVLMALWIGKRRVLVIEYDLDPEIARRYQGLTSAFKSIQSARGLWAVESHANVQNKKYHAGADSVVRRVKAEATFSMPRVIKSKIQPPMLTAGRQRLYLLPDRLLVVDGKEIGAVDYNDLSLEAGTTNFIEDGGKPSDAQQIDVTWKYVNKKGGPDRRFSDNRELPVMRYGELKWRSASGLNELHQVSNVDAARTFAVAVAWLADGLAKKNT
jgi:hypothetical protein